MTGEEFKVIIIESNLLIRKLDFQIFLIKIDIIFS